MAYIVIEDSRDVVGGKGVCRERHQHTGLTDGTYDMRGRKYDCRLACVFVRGKRAKSELIGARKSRCKKRDLKNGVSGLEWRASRGICAEDDYSRSDTLDCR